MVADGSLNSPVGIHSHGELSETLFRDGGGFIVCLSGNLVLQVVQLILSKKSKIPAEIQRIIDKSPIYFYNTGQV